MKILSIIKTLLKSNLIKTIVFNFRAFPIKTAICFPVVFYGRCQVFMGRGTQLIINTKPEFKMLEVGMNHSFTYGSVGGHPEVTYFRLNGTLELNGYNNVFANGCKIYIWEKGRLVLNGNILVQNLTKIHCSNSIVIGQFCSVSWESQIFDTNMHYLIDDYGNIRTHKGIIEIGNYCWIGNRCTIQKGTKLPDCSVVASNSMVNKDFTDHPSGIIAGSPARLIKTGQRRLFDKKIEMLFNSYFIDNPSITTVNIKDFVSENII